MQVDQNLSIFIGVCIFVVFGMTTFCWSDQRAPGKHPHALQTPWSVFSKSISVSQLVAVPLKSSGSHTSLRSRLPATSNWKMELSGVEGYMNRDSLTRPFVWLRWIQPDSNTVPALRRGLHYGQILLDTHSSKTLRYTATVVYVTRHSWAFIFAGYIL